MKTIEKSLCVAVILIANSFGFAQFPDANVRLKSANFYNNFYGKCMDVAGGAISAGTLIVQNDCQTISSQNFRLQSNQYPYALEATYLINPVLNKDLCVGIQNNTYANPHDQLHLVSCSDPVNTPLGTRWWLHFDPSTLRYVLEAKLLSQTGATMCIDVPNGSTSNGVILQVYPCNLQAANQQWFKLQ